MQITVDTVAPKRAKIKYEISDLTPRTYTQQLHYCLDSLYETIKSNSILKSGNQYKTLDFDG
jgi:hypothetical protein